MVKIALNVANKNVIVVVFSKGKEKKEKNFLKRRIRTGEEKEFSTFNKQNQLYFRAKQTLLFQYKRNHFKGNKLNT